MLVLSGRRVTHLIVSAIIAAAILSSATAYAGDGNCHWDWCKPGDGAILDDAERDHVAWCAPGLSRQGIPAAGARSSCECAFTGLTDTFLPDGRDGFIRMMRSEPNVGGSEDDRRLYRVVSNCFKARSTER
jgi:hypothetical protein